MSEKRNWEKSVKKKKKKKKKTAPKKYAPPERLIRDRMILAGEIIRFFTKYLLARITYQGHHYELYGPIADFPENQRRKLKIGTSVLGRSQNSLKGPYKGVTQFVNGNIDNVFKG